MSRFIDKLKEIGRAAPQPIGFGRGATASQKPRIVLIASIEQVNKDALADQIAGADAVLLSYAGLAEGYALNDLSKVMGDIPWGIFLGGDVARVEELVRCGCDFVVFPPDKMSLSLTQYENLGKILEVGTPFPDGLLRAVNQIPADGVLFSRGEKPSSLTWYDLMLLRHLANLLTRPLFVPVLKDVADKEFLTLWEAGVDAVVVPAGGPGRMVKELRTEIDKLSFPRERGAGRRDAVLPSARGQAVREEKEEEEEEEDE